MLCFCVFVVSFHCRTKCRVEIASRYSCAVAATYVLILNAHVFAYRDTILEKVAHHDPYSI
jgi:hypothetical protein